MVFVRGHIPRPRAYAHRSPISDPTSTYTHRPEGALHRSRDILVSRVVVSFFCQASMCQSSREHSRSLYRLEVLVSIIPPYKTGWTPVLVSLAGR